MPQDQTQTQLDPDAVNLAKAIRQTESGGNFQAKGKSGEYGAYQFTEPTWNSYAKKYGVNVPLAQATPEQQNEVAYKQIKAWKDAGNNVGQIASLWNSGKPDAYLDTSYKGVNKMGVSYDVPAYAKSVATAYQTIKNGGQVSVDTNNPSSISSSQNAAVTQPGQEQGLGSQLSGRLNDAATAISQGTQGKINPLSSILQTVGAGAGAVGDVTNAALGLIPGVKQVEGLIGKGIGALAQTAPGQAITQGYGNFAQAHPELAADLGAITDIASVVPVFKGVGIAKDLAGTALKGGVENAGLRATIDAITPEVKAGSVAGGKLATKNGIVKKGLLGVTHRLDDPMAVDQARVIHEVIPKFDKLKTNVDKLGAVEQGIGKEADNLRTAIKTGDIQPILTPDDLKTLQDGIKLEIERNPLLVGDAGLQSQKVFDEFVRQLPKGRDITMEDVLNARQGVDNWIRNLGKSGAFDPKTENALSVGLRAVRQGANDLIAEKLPDVPVRQSLKRQAALYRVRDVLGKKADAEVGSNVLSRTAKKHPVLSGLVKGGIKYGLISTGLGAGSHLIEGLLND